ncbi:MULTISPECIES: DUF6873 family GME fold protein [Clostridium]|uniref:DUF6873 domain-containing protein n=1 Tax=Clostridium cibarium TaxID=2762247 RepID=A0ABR8PPJ5_9CLOT|nr:MULTISPECIES: hypothetical protein [Clostridium]MBD7910099.1 hypothetical protein [Clostridium cibarium]
MFCFVDYRITREEINNLIKHKLTPIIIPKCIEVYDAIDGHVDIQLNILNKEEKTVIIQKNINKSFLTTLSSNNIKYILSEKSLGSLYPNDIGLNALITEKYFIHNINFTDKNLLESQLTKKIINVKQGYTKCSILPIKDDVFITSDKGIFNSLKDEEIDVLLIPEGDILLPPLNYGFIGGIGGMISENKLGLFGELNNYNYGDEVYKFLYKYDIEPISLKKGKLIDRGSLMVL